MAEPPPHIAQYLQHRYPRPKVDPEWLSGCYQWLISQPGANASSQKFLVDVESQLLQSDLTDSMVDGSGFPQHLTQPNHSEANAYLTGSPILVEITAMTEIAHSAYQLNQIRVVREERMRLGQTENGDDDEGDLEVEGEGPVPKYPRGMLKFELSDGKTTVKAIEYRSLPDLVLGQTPLGFKLLLKNPLIRHGIVFLEPSRVQLLGHQTTDREIHQYRDFARGLRVRMGLPIEPLVEDENDPQQQLITQPATVVPARPPLREISPPPEPPFDPTYNDDANLEPRRRKLPSTNATLVPSQTSSTSAPAPSATLVASRNSAAASQYFSNTGSSSATGLDGFSLSLTTAQASQAPVKDDVQDDEEELFSHFDGSVFLEAQDNVGPNENAPPPSNATASQAKAAHPPSNPLSHPSLESTITLSKLTATGPRSLIPEESIEIISFTPSQALPRSQSKSQSIEKKVRAGSSQQSSSGPMIDVSTDPKIDLLFLEDPDDPKLKDQGEKEISQSSQGAAVAGKSFSQGSGKSNGSGSSTAATRAIASAVVSGGRGQGRPIKALPRRSLASQDSSQPHRSQSHSHSQPRSRSQSQTKDVIEIDSSSSTSSPKVNSTKVLSGSGVGGDDFDFLMERDYDDSFEDLEEEQYDKENIPVMTRHVRRKVANSGDATLFGGISENGGKENGDTKDVIVLSDED